ncbi:hypothetical protein P7C70_g6346, partial [Phenoliferia sp. Uapishka_3]
MVASTSTERTPLLAATTNSSGTEAAEGTEAPIIPEKTLISPFSKLILTCLMLTGGPASILIIQYTQLITILGGGAGYLYVPKLRSLLKCVLTLNPRQNRGGLTGDLYGAPAPFKVTLVLLILSTILSSCFMPYIPPTSPTPAITDSKEPEKGGGIWGFMEPLKVFLPRRIEKEDGGNGGRYWGLTLLGIGCFTGVLALAYVPLMLQMTATNEYGFKPSDNGYLLSFNAGIRGCFLMFIFPRIISAGRVWYTSLSPPVLPPSPPTPPLGTHVEDFEPTSVMGEATEPVLPPKPTDVAHGSQFDLLFVRCSMVLDGLLTGGMVFASKGAHMYLAASLIPFASGTAPASKGVIMEMVPEAQKPDALSAIALVEMLATVSTVSLFGILFAALSDVGKARWTFVFNAALAMFAAGVLCFVRFPPKKRAVEV